jgi:hypothetical protein
MKCNISALESYFLADIDDISGLTPGDQTYASSFMHDDHAYNEYNEIDIPTPESVHTHASIASIRTS